MRSWGYKGAAVGFLKALKGTQKPLATASQAETPGRLFFMALKSPNFAFLVICIKSPYLWDFGEMFLLFLGFFCKSK